MDYLECANEKQLRSLVWTRIGRYSHLWDHSALGLLHFYDGKY